MDGKNVPGESASDSALGRQPAFANLWKGLKFLLA
jgi:hypothetical protein